MSRTFSMQKHAEFLGGGLVAIPLPTWLCLYTFSRTSLKENFADQDPPLPHHGKTVNAMRQYEES
ncbi:uncharacterized protein BDZ99DRAFT_251607 [Mytilinidion resinicola]|uniref:Uncharacterized protein n=1 Tax=Mytilinidion resinicola TaxID=574789 RepID=A0A6A6YXR6_9PEZI|nr:uncharacterized protein BDZ99DRAFT_251607 [Mytilinidion resinicola]KAF2813213.1 hypothetical protein BDZ99DRAFT_251607 [Mytilinidion resinicola]